MRRQDYHSNKPERRNGVVQTGHTCNALLRWGGAPWQAERFDVARGRAGGEDTEFFFRLYHQGARFEICEQAVVREGVPPARLSFGWLARRKYRSGQSYAAVTRGLSARIVLALMAGAKVVICAAGALAGVWSEAAQFLAPARGAACRGDLGLSLAPPARDLRGRGSGLRALSDWGGCGQGAPLRVFPSRSSRFARFSSRSAHGRRMMGSGERGVSICFTTLPAFARRLWTLNEIVPVVPTGTIGIHPVNRRLIRTPFPG